MKECGTFRMSTTGPNLIKTAIDITLRNECVLVLFATILVSSAALESTVSHLRPLTNTSHCLEEVGLILE